MYPPVNSLDTMNTCVPHVHLSTEISLAALLVVVMAPVENPVSKYLLFHTQICVNSLSIAQIVGPLIGEYFLMTV